MARAVTCAHGLDICPRCQGGELWPAATLVADHEGQVLEVAALLRDAVRRDAPVDDLLADLCSALDALDALFSGVAEAERND